MLKTIALVPFDFALATIVCLDFFPRHGALLFGSVVAVVLS
jgi:hypothetical protein